MIANLMSTTVSTDELRSEAERINKQLQGAIEFCHERNGMVPYYGEPQAYDFNDRAVGECPALDKFFGGA